jgi:general secretion pathway protein D
VFRPLLKPSIFTSALLAATSLSPAQAPQQAQPPTASVVTDALPSTVKLQFPNADISTILDLYETLTRKRLIRPNQVLAGQIYIVINDEVTREEAIQIIETTLLINGFTLVPSEDGKLVKVFGNGVNPRTGGIPIVSAPENLPEGEQVVTYLFKVKHADPNELAQMMQAYIAPSQAGYTSIIPLVKSQAVLVTENTPILRGLVRLVEQMDLPPAEVVSEWITLERADAKEVLEKLKEIFEKQPTQAGGAPGAPRAVPVTTPGGTPLPDGASVEATGANIVEISAPKTLTEDAVIVGKIKITADTRTNRIHVVTRPINLSFVRTLVEEFDRDVPFGQPAERRLRFVTAIDVLEPVIRAIQDPGTKEGGQGGSGSGTGQGNNRQTNGQNTFGGGFGDSDRNGSANGGGRGRSGRGGSGGIGGEELSATQMETTPKAVNVGNTRIIADPLSNKIIVLGNKEVKEKIFAVLDRLDVRPPQVAIHAVIGQLELNENEQFGVDYIIKKGSGGLVKVPTSTGGTGGTGTGGTGTGGTGTGNGTGGTVGTVDANVPAISKLIGFNNGRPALSLANILAQSNVSQIAVAGSTGVAGFFTAGNTLDAIVTALESTNRFRVTARPFVFTTNNKKAIISSGQEIAVPAQTQSSITNGNNLQDNTALNTTIEYINVDLKLEVVPLINSEREVTLDIVQRVAEVSGKTRIGTNDVPTIANRYIKTTVSVPNDGTIVLGGLIQSSDQEGRSGIPYLSRIPYVGALFRSTTKEKIRRELVVLLRPHVTVSPDETIQLREREQEYLKIEPDLETTLIPKGSRIKAPRNPGFRQPAPPDLRGKTEPSPLKK